MPKIKKQNCASAFLFCSDWLINSPCMPATSTE